MHCWCNYWIYSKYWFVVQIQDALYLGTGRDLEDSPKCACQRSSSLGRGARGWEVRSTWSRAAAVVALGLCPWTWSHPGRSIGSSHESDSNGWSWSHMFGVWKSLPSESWLKWGTIRMRNCRICMNMLHILVSLTPSNHTMAINYTNELLNWNPNAALNSLDKL